MSEVKDRHDCGECASFDVMRRACNKYKAYEEFRRLWKQIEADDEACSDFEPIGGWQE